MIESLGQILEREGGELLQRARRGCRLASMTTDDSTRSYRILQLTAGLIEDTAIDPPEPSTFTAMEFDAKAAAKLYVQSTLDNGWISDSDDCPVWELIELLGHDRNDMDGLAVYHEIAGMIDACDFFND